MFTNCWWQRDAPDFFGGMNVSPRTRGRNMCDAVGTTSSRETYQTHRTPFVKIHVTSICLGQSHRSVSFLMLLRSDPPKVHDASSWLACHNQKRLRDDELHTGHDTHCARNGHGLSGPRYTDERVNLWIPLGRVSRRTTYLSSLALPPKRRVLSRDVLLCWKQVDVYR